jgi:hypothetical protein
MKNNMITLVLSISTVVGFTLAYSQYSRANILKQELELQKELATQHMNMAFKAQEEAEWLQVLAKKALDRARSAEQSAIIATQRTIKTKLK